MLDPERLGQGFRMSMQLHILTLLVEPANRRQHVSLLPQRGAQVHKEHMLGTKLVANRAHLANASSPDGVLTPNQALDVLVRGPALKRFGIHGQ